MIDFLKLSCGGIVYSSFSPPVRLTCVLFLSKTFFLLQAATQIVEALKELDSSSGPLSLPFVSCKFKFSSPRTGSNSKTPRKHSLFPKVSGKNGVVGHGFVRFARF